MDEDARRWNQKYRDRARGGSVAPDPLLTAHAPRLLRAGGRALDLACGIGQNAIWLAERGMGVLGVDVSIEALRRARAEALKRRVSPLWVVADAARLPLAAVRFDLIVVVRFLDRRLFPWIQEALAPGGCVFYRTFNRRRLERHPDFNPRYLLEPGELARAFPALEPVAGEDGMADEPWTSYLVARKRP